MPEPAELKTLIKTRALELGFAACGIAAAVTSPHRDKLDKWLQAGHHADMAYMFREPDKRSDPAQVFPGARSVICLADSYYVPGSPGSPVARYAQCTDYHIIMKNRMKKILNYVREFKPEVKGRTYTDSAPLLEHYLAAEAGLGWIGKNSLLLSKENGSYTFLGEIIIDLELPPDSPAAEHCGSCRACLDACPTGAICEEYTVNARNCISYLTIEHKGDFTEEQAAYLHGQVFGCDKCQEACPWNRKLKTERPAEYGSVDTANIIEEIPSIDEEAFQDKYGDTPLARSGRQGIMRNIRALS